MDDARRQRRALRLAKLALRASDIWRSGARRGVAAVAALVGTAALGGFAGWPGPARLAAVTAVLLGAAAVLIVAARRSRPAPPERALAWLERAHAMPRGVMRPTIDRPLTSDALAERLWARARADALRPRDWPRLRSAVIPHAPVAIAGLAAVAFLLAQPGTPSRLAAAFSPYPTDLADARVVVTLVPPTGVRAPARRASLPLGAVWSAAIPPGARVDVRASGAEGPWRLERDGAPRPMSGGRAVWRPASAEIARIRFGSRLVAELQLRPAPDLAPTVAWVGPPGDAGGGALRLALRARDDWGSVAVALEISDGGPPRTITVDDAVEPGLTVRTIDLAVDPAAGGLARLTLVARDHGGAFSRSSTVEAFVPARPFADPLARTIVATRAELLRHPAARAVATGRLAAITAVPERFSVPAAWLALRAAGHRLRHDPRPGAVIDAAGLMWAAALALEGVARPGTEAVAAALARGDRAAAEALARALVEAAARAAGRGMTGPSRDPDTLARELVRRLAAGDVAGARALLDGLRAAGGASSEASARAEQARTLAREQTELTRRARADPNAADTLAGRQAALAAAAEALGRDAGPAAAAMARASNALAWKDVRTAASAQARASAELATLAARLDRAAQAAAEAPGVDPLGRPLPGFGAGRVELVTPERAREVEAVRRLLEARATDLSRPVAERAYYRRLLRRF